MRAILFDTKSIQRYIFSGNALKTNIGASYIVDRLFQNILVEDILRSRYEVDEGWKAGKTDFAGLSAPCAVAYIGGGNALILLREADEDECRDIVYAFGKKLLDKFPGLATGAAVGELDLSSDEAEIDSYKKLFMQLKQNQNTLFPTVNIPYTGLTHLCDISGETANARDSSGKRRFIARETAVKNEYADRSQKALTQEFADVLGEKYAFTRELEHLGQTRGEDYIAVVHIDGNNMGKKFAALNLSKRIAMSQAVAGQTHGAFRALLRDVVDFCDRWQEQSEDAQTAAGFRLRRQKDGERLYLPLRPIILGGDDITFVCAAKVALYCVEKFMGYLATPTGFAELPEGIDSCAGVAFCKTAYPFFRAYELAEQVCGAAKKKARAKEGSGWLDFILLHGEQSADLATVREAEYSGAWVQNLHFGPYEVGKTAQGEQDIKILFDCLNRLVRDNSANLSRNKLKELRFVLQKSAYDIKEFQVQAEHIGQSMPTCAGWENYAKNLWAQSGDERRTPYVDAIEMSDFWLLFDAGVKNG